MMRKLMVAAVAAMMMAGSAWAQAPVHKGYKPHWWDAPMRCGRHDDFTYCGAGAWEIGRLQSRGDSSIALDGTIRRWEDEWFLRLGTFFQRKSNLIETMKCGDGTRLLLSEPEVRGHGGNRRTVYFADTRSRSHDALKACLESGPMEMEVAGRTYRLGTNLLQEALENLAQYR